MKYLKRRKRRIEKKYAQEHGFFWVNCPACGEPFGGHEVPDDVPLLEMTVPDPEGSTNLLVICPSCISLREAEK